MKQVELNRELSDEELIEYFSRFEVIEPGTLDKNEQVLWDLMVQLGLT